MNKLKRTALAGIAGALALSGIAAPAYALNVYATYTTGCVGTSLVKFKVTHFDYNWIEELPRWLGGQGASDFSFRTMVYNYGYYPVCGRVTIIR